MPSQHAAHRRHRAERQEQSEGHRRLEPRFDAPGIGDAGDVEDEDGDLMDAPPRRIPGGRGRRAAVAAKRVGELRGRRVPIRGAFRRQRAMTSSIRRPASTPLAESGATSLLSTLPTIASGFDAWNGWMPLR